MQTTHGHKYVAMHSSRAAVVPHTKVQADIVTIWQGFALGKIEHERHFSSSHSKFPQEEPLVSQQSAVRPRTSSVTRHSVDSH